MPTPESKREKIFFRLKLLCIAGMAVTILSNKLNLNSFFIILYAAAWVAEGNFKTKWDTLRKQKLFIAYLLLVIIQIAGFFVADDTTQGIKHLERKAGFLIIPLLLLSDRFPSEEQRRKTMLTYSGIVILFCLIYLGKACYEYAQIHDISVFLYHKLVVPIANNAIYISAYVFFSYCFLLHDAEGIEALKKRRGLHVVLVIFHLIMLLLLSSKLIITITLLYSCYSLLKKKQTKTFSSNRLKLAAGGLLTVFIAAIFFITPIKQRFIEIFEADWNTLNYDKFKPEMYFSGLQYRLLNWRFGYEILNEHNAYITGVGPSNAQGLLDGKYKSYNMYVGTPGSSDQGFLGYNFHNQFLQTVVESGFTGLAVLLFWYFCLIALAYKQKNPVLTGMVVLIFFLSFTEALLERQTGLMLTTLLPLLYVRKKTV